MALTTSGTSGSSGSSRSEGSGTQSATMGADWTTSDSSGGTRGGGESERGTTGANFDPVTGDATSGSTSVFPEGTTTGRSDQEFFDDFERPDDPDLGNGWIEKTPAMWQIAGGRVVEESATGDHFTDTLFHRPISEQAEDIEVAIEFRIFVEDARNSPHPAVRFQPPSTEPGRGYSGYTLAPRLSTERLCILRFGGGAGFPNGESCSEFPDAALRLGETYRLTLRVEGDAPVELHGGLEHRVSAGEWVQLVAVSWTDSDASRIAGPGVWGAGEGGGILQVGHYTFESFRATLLD